MQERGEDMAHYIHTHVHETTRERFIVIEHGGNGTSPRSPPRLNSAHFCMLTSVWKCKAI
jgi:hypothetical protein